MMRPVSVHVTSLAPEPSSLTAARDAVDPLKVTLSWDDRTPVDYTDPTTWGDRHAEIGYRIERAVVTANGPSAWTQLAIGIANSTAFEDLDSDPLQSVAYRITTWNEGGEAESNVVVVSELPPLSTTVALTSDANPALLGEPVTFTATISNLFASGEMIFDVDGTTTSVQVTDGVATLTLDTLTLGDHAVTAAYLGDPYFMASTSDTLIQTVIRQPTATTVASSAPTAFVGQDVTFTASVRSVGATTVPSGSVQFTITNPGAIDTVVTLPLDANGDAAYTALAMTEGDHVVTADYLPTTSFEASTGTLTQSVQLQATTTVVTSSAPTSYVGQDVTFTASVRSVGAATVPTGSVVFTITNADAEATTATVPLDANGDAAFTAPAMSAGSHTMTAVYQPNLPFAASNGSLVQTVLTRATTTTLTSNRNPSRWGRSVTLTATVRTVVPNLGVPTGSVRFTITTAGQPDLVVVRALSANGVAAYTTTTLEVGSHLVTAEYLPSGALGYQPSSATLSEVVIKVETTVTLSVSPTTVVHGNAVTMTARVSPTVATGTVQFRVNGANFGAPVRVVNGRAVLATTALAIGTRRITAAYSGDAHHLASVSNRVTVTVT